MLKKLLPKMQVKSVFDLEYRFFKENNIKVIIFDIDNTLVPHGKPSTPEVKRFIEGLLEKGLTVCLLSNNCKKRVEIFNHDLKLFAIYRGMKPLSKYFKIILRKYNAMPQETAIIGDQLLSDILGGNLMGMFTILVSPISSKESLIVKPKRWLEKIILSSKK